MIGYKNALIATSMMACVIGVGGCAPETPKTNVDAYFHNPPHDAIADMQIVDGVRDSGVRAAIISQHTLYPYHFVPDSSALNELGERDVAVLAAHLRAVDAGQVNVRHGDAMASLYDARVQSVIKALRDKGVNTDHVQIADGSPGGGATPSEDVLRDVRRMHTDVSNQQSNSEQNTSTNQGTSSDAATTGGNQ